VKKIHALPLLAGTLTDSEGKQHTFSESDIRAIIEGYDPALHEAPLTIGHPKSDAPAWGWVSALRFSEGASPAPMYETHKVEPAFAEMVNAGRFPKRSISLYPPKHPHNPKPEQWYLRHIGYLGAQPPALKGFPNASFNATEEGVVSFMDWSQRDIASLFRGLRDWIIGKFGKDEADKVIPSYMVDSIQEDAVKDPAASSSYSEETDQVTKEELEARERALKAEQDKLNRERTEFSEREKKFGERETAQARAARQRECAEFVDAQVKAGRVLPAQRAGLVAFMSALAAEIVVEFGEGDKAVKKPGAEWLRDYLKAQPKVVDFEERGHRGVTSIDASNPEAAGKEIGRRAADFVESEKKAGRVVSIDVAVQHVINQGAQQ